MEVRGKRPGDELPAYRKFRQASLDLHASNRARVKHAREELANLAQPQRAERQHAAEGAKARHIRRMEARTHADRQDRLELSEEARAALKKEEAERGERVEELRKAYQAGRMENPDLSETAAARMLGG
jgi:hypothetical protein